MAKHFNFKQGDLVEPSHRIVASYSNYGGRPHMAFEPGMLGVVRHVDLGLGGAQVEFFNAATGCMQACRTTLLHKLTWPAGTQHPRAHFSDRDWWFCGSLAWRGAMNLLSAAAILRPDYLALLHVGTLRIPLLHASGNRPCPNDRPDATGASVASLHEMAQFIDALMASL